MMNDDDSSFGNKKVEHSFEQLQKGVLKGVGDKYYHDRSPNKK